MMTFQKKIPDNTLPLFYQKPVVLNKQQHRAFSLNKKINYAFAAQVNAVPITLVELPQIMQHYPVAFTAGDTAMPVAVLGLRPQENLFVDAKGQWLKDVYIPAYIRRYPFILASTIDANKLTLCVDDAPKVLIKSQQQPLFTPAGDPTDLVNNALAYCQAYQAAHEETQIFAQSLHAANVLVDRQATIKHGKKTLKLTGFRQLDQENFAQLPADKIITWHQQQWLKFIYGHIFADQNWQKLYQLLITKI